MRAYMAASQIGLLAGLLLAPALLTGLPMSAVIALCGLVTLALGTEGLRRYA
jgi:hypothetical protein